MPSTSRYALITLLVGYIAANLISSAVVKVMQARKLDTTVTHFVGSILKYAILVFVVIAALGRVGVQTASFVAIIGAAGLAIGLALQGSLSNFAAGFLLIIFRPIKAGEFIEVAGTNGVVQSVQLFTTTLTSGDNKMVVVPNSAILNGTIVNYSRMDTRRVDMTFGIGYGSDLRKAKQILERLVSEEPRILKEPVPPSPSPRWPTPRSISWCALGQDRRLLGSLVRLPREGEAHLRCRRYRDPLPADGHAHAKAAGLSLS